MPFCEKLGFFLWQKIRENVAVISQISVDNFDLTRKIMNFFGGEKNRENVTVFRKIAFGLFVVHIFIYLGMK